MLANGYYLVHYLILEEEVPSTCISVILIKKNKILKEYCSNDSTFSPTQTVESLYNIGWKFLPITKDQFECLSQFWYGSQYNLPRNPEV